jgi:hypothetical protein
MAYPHFEHFQGLSIIGLLFIGESFFLFQGHFIDREPFDNNLSLPLIDRVGCRQPPVGNLCSFSKAKHMPKIRSFC